MKLPKKIKVGGLVCDVKLDKEMAPYGEFNRHDTTIRINPQLAHQQRASSLFHECLHAVFQERNLIGKYTDTQEEQIVAEFEYGIMALLKNNPELVKYLLSKETK